MVRFENIIDRCIRRRFYEALSGTSTPFSFSTDGLVDCADSECCSKGQCQDSLMCMSSPDPLDILLRKQPPAVTASFYQKMKFLIEEQSVQSYAHKDEYSER